MSARLARALVAAAAASLAGTGACSPPPPNATPDGAAREMVERLRRVHGDPDDAKAVFELLSSSTKTNLSERSQRYSNASGKTIAPEAMIVPSRFLLRFEPEKFTARIVGAHALVDVTGLRPSQHAQIPCVFEEDGWRVEIPLPPLPPVQKRPGSEP